MIEITLKNGTLINITPNGTAGFTKRHIEKPGDGEGFSFFGRFKKNKPTIIGTITATAPKEGLEYTHYFSKGPRLVLNSFNTNKLKLSKPVVTKDSNNNRVVYQSNLIYIAKKNLIGGGFEIDEKGGLLDQTFKIETELVAIRTRTTGIINVIFGKTKIKQKGEKRKITVIGSPFSEFELAINKFTDLYDSNAVTSPTGDKVVGGTINKLVNSTEESVLTRTNSEVTNNTGLTFKTIKTKTDKNGLYSFYQDFPHEKVAFSADTKTRYSINVKTSYVNSSKFPSANWDENRFGWNGWYSKILTRNVKAKFSLELNTNTGSGLTIVDANAPDIVSGRTFNSSNPYIKNYGAIPTTKKDYSVSYAVTRAAGTWTLLSGAGGEVSYNNALGEAVKTDNVQGLPVWNNGVANQSDWTNSVTKANGGLWINMRNIAVSGAGTATATITFDFTVNNWGKAGNNVTLALDFDSVFS